MDLDLRRLMAYARRWWWLLAIVPIVAGATAFGIASRQTRLYSASAVMMVTPGSSSSGDYMNAIRAGQTAAATYEQLVVSEPVLKPVHDELQLPLSIGQLKTMVSASTVRNTSLIRISVSDTNADRAAAIANSVADHFAGFITQQASDFDSPARDALQGLVNDIGQQITDTQAQISAATADPNKTSEVTSLQTKLAQLQQRQADLLVSQQEMEVNAKSQQSTVFVSIPAVAASSPYAPRVGFYSAFAIFLGFCIAVGLVSLIEYLDNTVKADLDMLALVGAPLLSVVGLQPKLRGTHGGDQLFVLEQPNSNLSESVRLLRTNVEFAATAREIATLAVTSPGPGEGKSTIAANLAATMAQAGFSTVLIDADLRRPSQHKIFNTRNERGLTTLLTRTEHPWKWAAVEMLQSNLWLIPSGPIPPNPADLLSLDRLRRLLEEIKESVDVVVIDTPPVLAVSDPLVVATNSDAVLLVCRAGGTRIEALRRSAEKLEQGNVRLVGVVVNQQSSRGFDGYAYQGYYYGSDADESDSQKRPAGVQGGAITQPS
ncbi:MAG: polysaccharide biosynthesis tyrosine autokinase [Thermomicrobiales bacterium]